MKFAVYCAAAAGKDNLYIKLATDVGSSLAAKKIGLVYGGGTLGLMGAVANGVIEGGGDIVGVVPEFFKGPKHRHSVGQNIIVSDFYERKKIMAEMSDAFIALPGGVGTIDEITDVWLGHRSRKHKKPIGLLNISGFYDYFIKWVDHAIECGLIDKRNKEGLVVSDDINTLIEELCEKISTSEHSF